MIFARSAPDALPTPAAASDGSIFEPQRRSGEVTDYQRARLADALVRTSDGDRDAFREVYTLSSAKLFGICVMICGNRHAAEDVLQDVYLKVWRYAGGWDPAAGSAIAWLAAIARNRSIDWYRSQAARPTGPLEDAPDVPDATPCAETRLLLTEVSEGLLARLAALDPRTRAAIAGAFYQGFSYAELAKRDGVLLGTMKSVIRRGLARLKDQFDLFEPTPAGGTRL
jgi:RNA polymerase sigma factor (sigma-70 family)